MNLKDTLDKKQSLKFQLNKLDTEFIENTLSNNVEGIFYIPSKRKQESNVILAYLENKYENYSFQLDNKWVCPQIYFAKEVA